MRLNHKNSAKTALMNKIVNECEKIINKHLSKLDEISSTTAYDAAERSDSYNDILRAKKFREYGDKRREEEQQSEYEETFIEYDRWNIGGKKKFTIGKYVPANIIALCYYYSPKAVAIVRVTRDGVKSIGNMEILNDIAAYCDSDSKGNPRSSMRGVSALHAVNTAFFNKREYTKSPRLEMLAERKMAMELATNINNLFGTNLTFRCFYGSNDTKIEKDTLADYTVYTPVELEGEDEDGNTTEYTLATAKSNSIQPGYIIYYVAISNGKETVMINVYDYKKYVEIKEYLKPGRYGIKRDGSMKESGPWGAMCAGLEELRKIPAPTKNTSRIENIYAFLFNEMSDNDRDMIADAICDKIRIRAFNMDAIEEAYEKKVNNFEKENGDIEVIDDTEDVEIEPEDITDDMLDDM